MKYIIIGYIVWNIITFLIMWIDKYKAKKHNRRISEATLLKFAVAMGSLGEVIGGFVFRHKTKKIKFKIILLLALLENWLIMYFLLVKIL